MVRAARARKLGLLLAGVLLACGPRAAGPPELMVFAAASLSDVAAELGQEFERREGTRLGFNFGPSNALAQQITAAPGADVFLSADRYWVEHLERAGRALPGSGVDVWSNRLALIARRDAAVTLTVPEELPSAAFRYLAVADPDAVPAGRYARRRLESIRVEDGSLWSLLADRVVPALDVRAALALVESDPAILGIVYRTDAASSDRVRILHEFPPLATEPIVYRAVAVAGGNEALARRFLEFLAGPEARAVAARHGFGTPAAGGL